MVISAKYLCERTQAAQDSYVKRAFEELQTSLDMLLNKEAVYHDTTISLGLIIPPIEEKAKEIVNEGAAAGQLLSEIVMAYTKIGWTVSYKKSSDPCNSRWVEFFFTYNPKNDIPTTQNPK